jgi:diguanylate cyclase (GGDEF)-like protein/PAS domain S-box-containing protein
MVPGGADGHLACWGYFGSLDTPSNRAFVEKLKRVGVLVSADPVATAYSQILLWASIVERIGSFDTADVRAHLAGSVVDSPLGRLEIQENQHVLRNAFVGRLDASGLFKVLWRSEVPIVPLPWFGVGNAELPFKGLIMQVLKDLPEEIALRGRLETEVEERRKLAASMAKNERRLKEAELIAGVGGFERDFKTGEGYWSDNLFKILGYTPGAFAPSLEAFWRHVHEDDQEEFQRILAIAVFEAKDMTHQCRIRRADGQVRHIQVHAAVVRDDSGGVDHYHGTMLDVTERALAEERMRLLAQTDELTGIYNRRRFIELANKEIDRATRYGNPFSLIMFDIDKFKAVNDMYGHDVGDEVIKTIVDCGGAIARGVDFLGRLGGEEFAIALPQTDLTGAEVVAERVRIGVERCEIMVQECALHCTISLGVAELTGCADNFDSILKAADLALYRAKDKGRNRLESMRLSDLDIACNI